MTTAFRLAGLLIAVAAPALPAIAEIDRLGRACGAGREDACAQLATLAGIAQPESIRQTAARRLIQARRSGCASTGTDLRGAMDRRTVRLETEYLFDHDLSPSRRAEIAAAGDRFASAALHTLGLVVAVDSGPADAVVRLTLVGSARAWLFTPERFDKSPQRSENTVDGPAFVLYPDVAWEGAATVRVAGHCRSSEILRPDPPERRVLFGAPRRKQSEAPFRRDLETALAPVLLRLGKDLVGDQAVALMATGADSQKLRQAALAGLRDPGALALVARNDSSDFLRWTAVGKLTDQAVLARAARDDTSSLVRLAAVGKLNDPAALQEIARNDADPRVRSQAQARLASAGKLR